MSAQKLTLLLCQAGIATKTIGLVDGRPAAKEELINVGSRFYVREIDVSGGIRALAPVLTEIANDPKYGSKMFPIRGELIPGVLPEPIDQRWSSTAIGRWSDPQIDKQTGVVTDPTFREPEGGNCWVMLDVDQIKLPDADPVRDPQGTILEIVQKLPEYFRDVTVFWQLSSQAGLGGKVNAHLFFWLNRRVPSDQLRAWAAGVNKAGDGRLTIDPGLYTPVQPHFIAPPIFTDGVKDPLPQRMGLLEGSRDEVIFPAVAIGLKRGTKRPLSYEESAAQTNDEGRAALDELCSEIRTLPIGERPYPLFKICCRIGRLIAFGNVSPTDAEAEVTKAIGTGPLEDRHERSMSNGLQRGYGDLIEILGTAELPLTDVGNAQRFVERYGHEVRYCALLRQWLIWDGCRWARDDKGRAVELAKATARHIREEARAYSDEKDKGQKKKAEALRNHANKSESNHSIKGMLDLARTDPKLAVLPDELDADPWLFNCANGTIDLRTGDLRPHSPADLITLLSPVAYNPGVPVGKWEKFVNQVTSDNQELAQYLCRAVGYMLTGTQREKKFFFAFGKPDSAKSTFLDAITATFGEYAAGTVADTWLVQTHTGGNRGDLVRLRGKRLVTTSEFPPGKRFDEALIMRITGGDPLLYAKKHADEIEFRPTFKILLAANDAPEIRHNNEAMWARCDRVPFDKVIEKKDPKVREELCDTLKVGPEILAWAVRGCLEWQENGLGLPAAVAESTAQYRADMDLVNVFVREACVLEAGAEISKKGLRDAFDAWRGDNGEKLSVRAKLFNARLRQMGCSEKKASITLWVGIRLSTATEIEDLDSEPAEKRQAAEIAEALRRNLQDARDPRMKN